MRSAACFPLGRKVFDYVNSALHAARPLQTVRIGRPDASEIRPIFLTNS